LLLSLGQQSGLRSQHRVDQAPLDGNHTRQRVPIPQAFQDGATIGEGIEEWQAVLAKRSGNLAGHLGNVGSSIGGPPVVTSCRHEESDSLHDWEEGHRRIGG
jgi:hypothetical protein